MNADPAQPTEAEKPAPKSLHLSMMGRLRAYFFAGVLVTAPISITFYLAWIFINFVDRSVIPLLPPKYNPENYLPISVPGLGLVIAVVGLTFVGMATAGFVGKFWTRFTDAILTRMPVISGLYSAVKQIFETVLAQKSNAFREVALVEYPRKGIWTIGFITGKSIPEVRQRIGQEMVNVFIPTTPNPTSGFLLFFPRTDVIVLDISVDDALKHVVSGGIVSPDELKNGQPDRKVLTT